MVRVVAAVRLRPVAGVLAAACRPDWATLTASAQIADPGSMLQLYRDALRLRRDHPASESLRWRRSPAGVLVFDRPSGLIAATNLSAEPATIALPNDAVLALASGEVDGAVLPPDTSAWWLSATTPGK